MTAKDQAIALDVVAYLDIGAGGYLDLGCNLTDEQLQKLPNGRHALGIIGTYGIDGYVQSQPPAPDCRTCAWQNPCKLGLDSIPDCTNGDKYEAAPKVVLWRTE